MYELRDGDEMINTEVVDSWRIWIEEQLEDIGIYGSQVEIYADIVRIYKDTGIKITPMKFLTIKRILVELLCNYIRNTEDIEVAERLCKVIRSKGGLEKYIHIDDDLIEFNTEGAIRSIKMSGR